MTTCPNCRHHHVDEMAQIGVCRRYPPQAQQLGANWNATFPPVNKNWTCGEWQAQPSSIDDGWRAWFEASAKASVDNAKPPIDAA